MKKFILSVFLAFASTFMFVSSSFAAFPSAGNIFGSLGGTTTVDQGGAIHSQARSIYSLGGGMTSFQGKKVSFLAADAPGFSAGCSGISWHFGGFAFISVDEIRQLVEAIAQASLGVAIDLAMQTLCPQCYAVMSKLRDIANQMRNASADACKVAKNFGNMLKDKGIFSSDERVTDCSTEQSRRGESGSFLESLSKGDACGMLNVAEAKLTSMGNDVSSWLEGGNASGKKVSRERVEAVGNMTYKAFTALGYSDGFVMSALLSSTGMTIISPTPDSNCTSMFSMFPNASPEVQAELNAASQKILSANSSPKIVKTASATTGASVSDASNKITPAGIEAGDATKGGTLCYAPPLISGVDALGKRLICGFDPANDMIRFANKFLGGNTQQLAASSIGAMCGVDAVFNAAGQGKSTVEDRNPPMYVCGAGSAECSKPTIKPMQELLAAGEVGTTEYSGLAWMVMDALYAGVDAVVAGNKTLPPETIKILSSSGYPLYRIINLAAVYPGMADEILQAYSGAIALQHATETLDKVVRYGQQPFINMNAVPANAAKEINEIKREINKLASDASAVKQDTLKMLSQKRALVDSILQVNKALQAEVISNGLSGNADLALSLKQQATKAGQ